MRTTDPYYRRTGVQLQKLIHSSAYSRNACLVLRDPGSKRGHSHATRSVISRHSVRRPNIRILFHRKRRTRGRRRRTRRVSRKKSFHRRIDKITLTLTRNNLQLRTLEFYHRAIVLTFQGSTDKDL